MIEQKEIVVVQMEEVVVQKTEITEKEEIIIQKQELTHQQEELVEVQAELAISETEATTDMTVAEAEEHSEADASQADNRVEKALKTVATAGENWSSTQRKPPRKGRPQVTEAVIQEQTSAQGQVDIVFGSEQASSETQLARDSQSALA